jgi:ADP-ribose pyrophosphatase YjhB (NUDIX family)
MNAITYRFLLSPTRTLFRKVFRPKTTGVKVLICCNNEYLLIKNTYGKSHLWTLPGGGAKRNENQTSAAKREVKEEVGIKLKNVKKIGTFLNEDEPNKDTINLFTSRVENKNVIIDKKEIKETAWFTKKELSAIKDKSDILKKTILEISH